MYVHLLASLFLLPLSSSTFTFLLSPLFFSLLSLSSPLLPAPFFSLSSLYLNWKSPFLALPSPPFFSHLFIFTTYIPYCSCYNVILIFFIWLLSTVKTLLLLETILRTEGSDNAIDIKQLLKEKHKTALTQSWSQRLCSARPVPQISRLFHPPTFLLLIP